MHRVTTYALAGARSQDFLQAQQNTMSALGYLAQAVIGGNTGVVGLGLNPTTPSASLSVVLSPGAIYQIEAVEATAWSSLPANTSEMILKQGLLNSAATITLAPPGTIGYSQVFLIEVQYADLDTNPVLLSYYNASNPAAPYVGPGGTGVSQSTARNGVCAVQVKAGVAAPAGSQISPDPDVGWTPLWYVTVSYGQTTITAGNIVPYGSGFPASPWFPNLESLPNYFVPVVPATTFYVNAATGSDTNNGLTAGTAFATLQYAINYINSFQCASTVTVNVAAGTYSGVTISSSLIAKWNLVGAGYATTILSASTAGVNGGNAFIASGSSVVIGGFTMTAVTQCCIATSGGQITMSATQDNAFIGLGAYAQGISANTNSNINVATNATLRISGTFLYCICANSGSRIAFGYHGSANFTPNILFGTTTTQHNVWAFGGGTVTFTYGYVTWSGATPTTSVARYGCDDGGGIVATGSSSATWIPGTTAGTPVPGSLTARAGWYDN